MEEQPHLHPTGRKKHPFVLEFGSHPTHSRSKSLTLNLSQALKKVRPHRLYEAGHQSPSLRL